MKVFQAYGAGSSVTAKTPRQAAAKFFACYPRKRKCSVTEGEADGMFFSVAYGFGRWPQRWSDVTKGQVLTLPDVPADEVAA